MIAQETTRRRGASWLGRLVVLVGFAVGVVLLMLWLAGRFSPKVPTAGEAASRPPVTWAPNQVEAAKLLKLPLTESAVGTIRAVHETSIASRLLARVLEVGLKAGQRVKKGEVLVRLDDSDLRARLEQEKAALASAEAMRAQAVIDEQRVGEMRKTAVASQQEHDRAATTLKSANAEVLRHQEVIKEVQSQLDYATVRAPMDGTVVDKRVDVGDTVMPGQVLATLYDPERMQLVASVRESLAYRLKVGQSIGVQVEAMNKLCDGTVSEIVPEAQSASRTFQVKVTGPCPSGVYSGMFGRIIIPLDDEQVLVITRQAVRQVGQLELVEVVEKGESLRRAIRTGRPIGDAVEVLSGLKEGEQVLLGASSVMQEVNRD